jgi:hypothetical protein
MFRFLMVIALTPVTIAVVDFLVLLPLGLTLFEGVRTLMHRGDYREMLEIVTGIGVILIAWGVALEERHELRDIFNVHSEDEDWQLAIDQGCKATGIGALVLGLFAEMCIEAIKLPNHILNTEGVNEILVGVSWVFLALTGYVLIRHIVLLVPAVMRRRLPASKGVS